MIPPTLPGLETQKFGMEQLFCNSHWHVYIQRIGATYACKDVQVIMVTVVPLNLGAGNLRARVWLCLTTPQQLVQESFAPPITNVFRHCCTWGVVKIFHASLEVVEVLYCVVDLKGSNCFFSQLVASLSVNRLHFQSPLGWTFLMKGAWSVTICQPSQSQSSRA